MGKSSLLLTSLALLIAGLLSLSPRPSHAAMPPTVLANGSFEIGSPTDEESPEGWAPEMYKRSGILTWDDGHALVGRRSVKIAAPFENDASWSSTVPVQPHTTYALSGWIKTENVAQGAGANLCIMGTWTHTPGVFGTSDWTYVSMIFDSGDQSQVTIGARLGYWAGTTTGTAWFDGLRLTPIDANGPAPAWKILVLIYRTTDFTYVDTGGVERHVVARMSLSERNRAASEATAFVTQDIPALTSGIMTPTVTIRYPDHPLTRLSPNGSGWWPSPEDTAEDRDPSFDSVIVIWDPRAVDQRTGEDIWIGSAAGLTLGMGTGQTYEAQIIESTNYGHRNVFKHEWGHSILFYFESAGTAPLPAVTNHAVAGQYVHCTSGAPYVWLDESDANPIPNSIYHNSSGFTHDYYSGTTATPDQPARCLGITREAWAKGGPVSHPGYYPYYHQLELSSAAATLTGAPGETARQTLTITNTGNLTDTFHISVEGAAWEVDAPATTEPVGAGRSATVEVAVHIPPAALDEAHDVVPLTITSERDPSQAAQASITTIARVPPPAPVPVVWLPLIRR